MVRDHFLLFDEFIPTGPPIPYWSSDAFDERLGKYDAVSLFAILENCTDSSGSVSVALWHSSDGVHFVEKATTPEITISWVVPPLGNLVGCGSDPNAGTNPPVPFFKFVKISVVATAASAIKVKVYATLRDSGG